MGVLLVCALVDELGVGDFLWRYELLGALREMFDVMCYVLILRDDIGDVVCWFVLFWCYWVVVGNGLNKVVVYEVWIKLFELCYKSIVCDVIEDKKHIDFLLELLILVCVVGL